MLQNFSFSKKFKTFSLIAAMLINVSISPAANGQGYHPNCTTPSTREDATFCDSTKSTAANLELVKIQKNQYFYSILGLLFVFGSFLATAVAARAAHISAKAARRAAEGSDAILAHAERSSQQRLRAYIFLNTADLLDGNLAEPPIKGSINKIGALVTIKNSGQTPGYNLASWLEVAVADIHYQEKLLPPMPIQEISTSTLPPYGMINKIRRLERKLTPEEVNGIQAGTHGIFIYGRIQYKDAFLNQRFSNFRLIYTGQWPPNKGAVFTFCSGGNETDDVG